MVFLAVKSRLFLLFNHSFNLIVILNLIQNLLLFIAAELLSASRMQWIPDQVRDDKATNISF